MKKLLLGAFGALAAGIFAVMTLLYTGSIDVAADTPHSSLVFRLIEWSREQSIARSIQDIKPPSDWSAPERLRRGAGNYAAMCANCHLSPGVENTEIRQGLYPVPPNLALKSEHAIPSDRITARQFWIIKHGIKASGMPAWSKGGMDDQAIWDLTAFLNVLPVLSSEQYRQHVAASDGHSHAGLDHHPKEAPAPSEGKPHGHKHGEHKH